MANIWEKDISILAGNLNSCLSYLITTVTQVYKAKPDLYGLGKSRSMKSRSSLCFHISLPVLCFSIRKTMRKSFGFLLGFSLIFVVFAANDEFYCNLNPGQYKVCRTCNSLDQDCEESKPQCGCDNIEIGKAGSGKKIW